MKLFCRGRYKNCNMIYLNQNLFSLDRQNVRENCKMFILLQQNVKTLTSIHQDFFNDAELNFKNFIRLCNELWKELITTLSLIYLKIETTMVN